MESSLTEVKEFLQSNERHFTSKDFLHHHPSLLILRNWYVKLLKQWYDGQIFDSTMCYVFETIPHLFLKLSNYLTEENLSLFKELIYFEEVIEGLNRILEQIAINGKFLQDPLIRSVDNLCRAIQRLQRNHSEIKPDLFHHIVKCLCSNTFFDQFLQSTTQEIDHSGQKFLLHTCTDYVYSHPTDPIHKQSLLDIRHSLLHRFVQWFVQQSSFYRSWNHRLLVTLRQLCFLLTLSIQHHRMTQLDQDTLNDYCQLIDTFVNILYSILQSENSANQKLIQSLLATIAANFLTMISSNQLEKYLKSKHITSVILKLIDVDNEDIQLNAFRIFSAILTEQDTKMLSNSTNIAHLFGKFLTKIIDDDNQILRFYALLHCLKDVIHYDQIKEELTKQNIIPLLLRCTMEMKFKPLQVQQPALEILLALTFNKDAYRLLKDHVEQFRSLLTSPHQGISRAVHCLLWRYEKLDESKRSSVNHQYDLMLSYSHSNQDLADRINDHLTQDHFRLSFNCDETFGLNMQSKIDLIDQSRYILLCLSNEYKQNSYCRCEAYYAHERQYKIIPLIFSSNFHLDGWLIEIIKGKIYIDFGKLDFDLAYQTLKNEINRETKSESFSYRPMDIESIPTSIPQPISTPSDMKQWDHDHVRKFLLDKQFHSLVSITSDMNGSLLYDLYTMCKENRESMFHTLKKEISVIDPSIPMLTISNYLRFLREIDQCVMSVEN